MSLISRQELANSIHKEYKKSSKVEKSKLLDAFCLSCNYNRKYAIRILQKKKYIVKVERKKHKVGRPPQYNDPVIKEFLVDLRIKTNQLCSKRLKESIPTWMNFYETKNGKKISNKIKISLCKISCSTIDRILKKSNYGFERIGLSTTKPGSIIKKQIKINTNQWNVKEPGFLEADTVAHCGGSVSGLFVYTLNTVDIATSWIESRALWGKGQKVTVAAMAEIENSLPFKLKGLDTDNGSEFINWHMINHLRNRRKKKQVIFTRARPYHKNDNAHIEGKNWTHTRQYLGYSRFDNIEILSLLNDIYTGVWPLFFNFFIPSQKCVSKIRIGSKIIKKYDKAKTPYKRVINSEFINENIKKKLTKKFAKFNPYDLQKELFSKIKIIKQITMQNNIEIDL